MFGQLEFYGTIYGGKLEWSGDQKLIIAEEFAKCKDGTQVWIRFGRLKAPKTSAQLKTWWGLFAATIITEFNDRGYDTSYILKVDKPTGIPISRDLLKEYLYNVCPVFRDGRRITMSSMDTEEMSRFFDDCRNFAASQWNIFVPEPDPNWREKEKTTISDLRNKDNGRDSQTKS